MAETRLADNKIICLMGPTCTGKTALSLRLAEQFPVEIISVDSALVYRGMDIGTAKPSAELLEKVPHHLIDILDPAEAYSAADFREQALQLIADIQQRNKLPVLAGGTMLYFKALLEGLADLPSADEALRKKLEQEAAQKGWAAMHQQLAEYDPVSAERVKPTDAQRIQRALEVYFLTGKPLNYWHEKQRAEQALPFTAIQIALLWRDRSKLHQLIANRFDEMLEQGFIDEVKALKQRSDLHLDLPAIRAVGYRQAWDYLDGKLSYEEMRERGIIATRQLAKRQFTWLRSWPDLNRIYLDDCPEGVEISDYLLAQTISFT